jgi:hypothetical protein
MTEGRQPFTAEIKTLAKGPSTYDPLENNIRGKRAYRRASGRTGVRAIPVILLRARIGFTVLSM